MDNGLRISTFGITLENEFIAAWFIWGAYVYFLIRYIQHSAEAKEAWHLDRVFEITQDPLYTKLFDWTGTQTANTSLFPGLRRKFFLRRSVNWRWYHDLTDRRSDFANWSSGIIYTDQWSPLRRRDYVWPASKAYFKALIRHPGWSNYILPLLLAALALAIAVLRVFPIWHHPQPPLIGSK